jgi:hypothetical protein
MEHRRLQPARSLGTTGSLVLFALLMASSPVLANPTDSVVILTNGDRMTGEIKSLQYGILSFKADYMSDPVKLDWKRVSRLESKGRFIVALTNGALYTGIVGLAALAQNDPDNFQTVKARQADVIRILPSETTFLQQLNGTIDFGLGYTSGNSQYQTQLSATANYRKGNHAILGSTSMNLSGQSGGSKTARYDFELGYRRLFGERWFAGGVLGFLKDEHQSLDLRTTGGGLIGRGLIVTDQTNFSVASGVVVTREMYSQSTGVDQHMTNAEGLVGLEFHTFRFRTTDISSTLKVFPSFSVPGRVRIDLDSGLRIELVKDFFWSLSLYENFDSKPPISARKNDFGINTSFGWKF